MLLIELIKKDFLVFVSDRKSMLITFLVPICIATFLGSIMGNISGGGGGFEKIPLLVVDQDQSQVSAQILASIVKSKSFSANVVSLDQAKQQIHDGKVGTAAVFDKGFGQQAVAAMTGGPKPRLDLLTDPSKSIESQAVEGSLIQTMVPVIAKQAFGGSGASFSLPFDIHSEPQTGGQKPIPWSGSAHAFAGLGVQALFFGAMEAAMGIMRDRKLGIWSRLRAAPASKWMILVGKFIGSTLLAFLIFLGVFTVGSLIFGFRITGSWPGFFLVCLAIAAMTAGTGLFIAALGRTEQQSRGLSILVILSMLMLGGAWVPIFVFPSWVQSISLFTPVRWAVDGIDLMTWRGGSFADASRCAGVLAAFAFGLVLVAGRRFRWRADEA
jgi:ABC-2 type transport system permease protein